MFRRGTAALLAALALFLIYFANVATGAAGGAVFFTDVEEMLTLLAACICFVIGVLLREAAANRESSNGKAGTNGAD